MQLFRTIKQVRLLLHLQLRRSLSCFIDDASKTRHFIEESTDPVEPSGDMLGELCDELASGFKTGRGYGPFGCLEVQ
ncbi:hypothetical protein ACQXX2_04615 [Corynebacterium diphtheriae]